MSAFDQSIYGFNEVLDIIDEQNALVCGSHSSMQLGIGGSNVCDGFEKGRRALVEMAYRKLQLLLRERVPKFCQDGAIEIVRRLVCLQVIQLPQDVAN